ERNERRGFSNVKVGAGAGARRSTSVGHLERGLLFLFLFLFLVLELLQRAQRRRSRLSGYGQERKSSTRSWSLHLDLEGRIAFSGQAHARLLTNVYLELAQRTTSGTPGFMFRGRFWR
ncbi:unnamed protein product, partial [Scytosiphon promiscuus]